MIQGYRTPPHPIPRILGVPPTPVLTLSPDGATIAFLTGSGMPAIVELAEPELRLAGTRINPRTSGPSRERHMVALEFATLPAGERRPVRLPVPARVSHVQWSPDGSRLAFTNTAEAGIELWVANARTAEARRVCGPELNATLGWPYDWAPDGDSFLVKRLLPMRGPPPAEPGAPSGPMLQESTGDRAPVRTYQDLLASEADERLFEYHASAELARVPAEGGAPMPIGIAGMIANFSVSPDGQYLLLTRLKRPFSYLGPFPTFARTTLVVDRSGRPVYQVVDRPGVTLPPIGRDMVLPGPRAIGWRADAPAELVWAEAADDGDARRDAAVRDRVVLLAAPFDAPPRPLIQLDQRFAGIQWGRADLALVHSRWDTTARTRTYRVDPSRPWSPPRVLWDRSSEDRYSHPGSPVMVFNRSGSRVLRFTPRGDALFLRGEGASPSGNRPFLDRLQLATGESTRIWQAEDPFFEYPSAMLDDEGRRLLTRRESHDDPPNFFIRDTADGSLHRITDFPDPAPEFRGISRTIIHYVREDGVPLSGALYTPAGYRPDRDGPLPLVLWAYPREFRDPTAAGQVTDSPHRFARPSGPSPLFLLTQGYALLDGPAMPIIGEGEEEPNDRYVEQLVASARAAVEAVVSMGIAERGRIGAGGHSYGAAMTANLLAHSDLFRAGVARSGAYNRSLTPFGFQAEPRSYWEAREVYHRISPFDHADRIRDPLLLIHGEKDNNPGTFPLQSERMYQALKGHGAVARLVILPHESHAYSARESVLHVLAETIEWFDRYVKNASAREAEGEANTGEGFGPGAPR
jgi:dipeptidyl aminopeptidase/acylaminoacyl peptidase